MTALSIRIAIVASVTLLAACSRDDRRQTPGETAGHAAYEIEKGTKKAAKEVSKDVKSFAHDARQGFEEAKQKDAERKREEKK